MLIVFDALPEGCPHIAWTRVPALNDAGEPNGDQRVVEQFATWIVAPGDLGIPDMLAHRHQEIAGRGLAMVGEPHRCQVDPTDGQELWAAVVAPTG